MILWIEFVPREVCLKHRKIRREIFLRVRVHHRTGSGVCLDEESPAQSRTQPPFSTSSISVSANIAAFHAAEAGAAPAWSAMFSIAPEV